MVGRSTLAATVLWLAAGAAWADDLKSGPQVGENRRGFMAQFQNGVHAGQRYCPV
jgi:hypothetical protein